MYTKKEENLHALIQSMSSSEKRFFKRFVKSRKENQNDYLSLFEALNSMKVYSRAELLKKVTSFNFHKHLEVKQHYLFQLLLDSLRQFRDSKLTLHNSLIEIDILIEKGLYHLAYKRIKSQKHQAQQTDNFFYEIQLLQKELLLTRYIKEIDLRKNLKDINNCYAKSENLLNYQQLYYDLSQLVEQNSFVRNSKQFKRFELFKKHALFNDVNQAKSFSGLYYFYLINYYYHASTGENKTSYNYSVKMHKLILGHTERAEGFSLMYLRAISARFSTLILKGYKYDEYNLLMNELKVYIRKIKDPEMQKIALSRVYQYQLIAFCREEKYLKALDLLKDATLFVKENEILADGNAIKYLTFDIAKTYFITGQYVKANVWFLRTNYPDKLKRGCDIYAFSRILSLLCDIFLNQTENVKYNALYLKRQLSKLAALFEFESFLITRISQKFIYWNDCNNSEKIILLKEFIEELKTQLSNKWRTNTVLYFDFENWATNLLKAIA
jgi:hypothetical protein